MAASLTDLHVDRDILRSFSGMNINVRPEDFLRTISNRMEFQIGPIPEALPGTALEADRTARNAEITKYTKRKIALVGFYLTGSAKIWFDNIASDHADKQTWVAFENAFKTQFSTRHFKYNAQLQSDHIRRNQNETIRNLALRIDQIVDIGWQGDDAGNAQIREHKKKNSSPGP